MKCYIFSIGETTTDLCVELIKSYGFDVVLFQDNTSLWEKLKRFYEEAYGSGDAFAMRIDADIIPNRNVIRLAKQAQDWTCASGYDWYSQDRKAISIHVMSRPVIEACLRNVYKAEGKVRPETYLWRLPHINPLTRIEDSFNCGIHGYAQTDQRDRIKELKASRDQNYDWELLDRIESL